MTSRDALERALPELLEPLGVCALGRDVKVVANQGECEYTVRLAMPPRRVDVKIDPLSYPEAMLRELEIGARVLFAETIDHIAKHDRSPIDRMKAIEDAATALLDAMHVPDGVRMLHSTSSAVLNAAYQLRHLLGLKPGSPAWGRRGYGAEQDGKPTTEAR